MPYSQPPYLAGYHFEEGEHFSEGQSGTLVSLRLEPVRRCNLRCRYCTEGCWNTSHGELQLEDLSRIIREAAELSARSVIFTGPGEPTLHSRFPQLISLVNSLGMTPVVSTNCTTITPRIAEFLYKNNASVIGKFDSISPDLQDYISGVPGTWKRMQGGLWNLVHAGFTQEGSDPRCLRLSAACSVCVLNEEEVAEIWRCCRESRIFPQIEFVSPETAGRNPFLKEALSPRAIRDVKTLLLALDRKEYGFDWDVDSWAPGPAGIPSDCSMEIAVDGNVRACFSTKLGKHSPFNIRYQSLTEVMRGIGIQNSPRWESRYA